ncbi:MAG: mechanosensitive ion channel protein MscS [Nitrobacter sp. 62-13]|uniref:mechanosensitive ion channel family protein n=1 Tax=Nitrobacter sp. 62-13 TaxID=1895797 RepID=UPI0009687B64|nr:mechanosensitive ion channel family protein [Nitrobacter sp. 62-13]OJU25685.1 MAG: mechanosensitive ion channel protein MscS [Nitrobacter sp. 62-13]
MAKLLAKAVVLVFVLLSTGTLARSQTLLSPLAQSSAIEPAVTSKTPVTVAPAANDRDISKRLEGILKSTGWFESPRVSVREGVVSLDGTTNTQEHKNWAGDLAEKTQDVVAVVNRLQVRTDVGTTFGKAGVEFKRFYRKTVQSWPLVILAICILAITWLLAKLVALLARHFLSRRITSPLLLTVMARVLSVPVFLFGVYFILQVAGLTRLALTVLGGTSLIGILIGFAFRDIAENFLASLLLSVRNPFRSGDLVEVAGHTGIVQNLNTRTTILLTLDGSHVQIPNAIVYKNTIENFSSNPSRRATFTVGIGYESSAAKAQKLVSQVLLEHPAVLGAPEALVLVEELGAATVNIRILYWFDSTIYSPAKINSALLRQTKKVLHEGGIILPDPAREVVFPKGVPVTLLKHDTEERTLSPFNSIKIGEALEGDDASDATEGEGNLSNETKEVCEQSEDLAVQPNANLLKD